MFTISPTFDVAWIPRRPRNAIELEINGWKFLPLRREWDAAERAQLSEATGLAAISPGHGERGPQAWWIAFLEAYVRNGDPIGAALEAGDCD